MVNCVNLLIEIGLEPDKGSVIIRASNYIRVNNKTGVTVDIYFKVRNEKYALLKSSTTDEDRVIDHDPADKMIRTPGGYPIKLNNEEEIKFGL